MFETPSTGLSQRTSSHQTTGPLGDSWTHPWAHRHIHGGVQPGQPGQTSAEVKPPSVYHIDVQVASASTALVHCAKWLVNPDSRERYGSLLRKVQAAANLTYLQGNSKKTETLLWYYYAPPGNLNISQEAFVIYTRNPDTVQIHRDYCTLTASTFSSSRQCCEHLNAWKVFSQSVEILSEPVLLHT